MSGDTPDRSLAEHKKHWNALATDNDRYAVRSVDHEQSDEEYEASGRKNVQDFIEDDCEIIRRLQPLSDRIALEIGCGSGRMTKSLARVFRHVMAVDISAVMLEKARAFANAENITFVESSGSDVPVLPGSIDLAFSYIVYQHFPSKEAIEASFRGVHRALSDRGLFKVQIRGLKHPDPNHWSWGPHYEPAEAHELARSTGFDIVASSGEGTRSHWLLLSKT